MTRIPPLGYALLGLIQLKPASGYDLRKIFSSTSMQYYSDSPGAIYPALHRLEQRGLVRGTIEEGTGLRRRQVFHLTARGASELKKWIMRPITPDHLTRGFEEIMLRFAFSESAAGLAVSLELLKSLEAALKTHFDSLENEYAASHKLMTTSGRLAFQSGLKGTEHLLEWTESAIAICEKETGKKKGSASWKP